LTITPGNTSANLTINALTDAVSEGNETAIATLGTPTNATLGAIVVATTTITNVNSSGFDSDAQAFFTAANITDATQRTAVNNLVIGLKANGTWADHQAIYPFVGGSASQHSYNLKNPATFQITWSGTVTHNANGVTGNGSTGFGDTGFNPSTNGTLGNSHISLYSRTDQAINLIDMGATIGATAWLIHTRLLAGDFSPDLGASSRPNFATPNSLGYFAASRLNTTNISGYKDGVVVINNVSNSTSASPNGSLYLLASNQNGSASLHSQRNFAFASIGLGLTSAESTADYTTIQAYETALNRSIDPDAQAFFTAANITDATQRSAVNNLVLGLKANNTWSKYQAIYPFVGGSASQHSYNLKNPSTFQITWGGSVTHNANGITGNTSNAYGDTGFTPNTNSTLGNNHISLYSRTDKTANNSENPMGAFDAGGNGSAWAIVLKDSGNTYIGLLRGSGSDSPTTTNADSRGWFVVSRNDTSLVQCHRNSTQIITNGSQSQGSLPTISVAVLASKTASSTYGFFTPINIALATIGTHLTSANVTDDYSTIQAFETALSRQV